MRGDNDTFRRSAEQLGMKVRFAWWPVRIGDKGTAWWQLVAYRREPYGYGLKPGGRGAHTTYRNVYYGGAKFSVGP